MSIRQTLGGNHGQFLALMCYDTTLVRDLPDDELEELRVLVDRYTHEMDTNTHYGHTFRNAVLGKMMALRAALLTQQRHRMLVRERLRPSPHGYGNKSRRPASVSIPRRPVPRPRGRA
jgi:spermidine synthase